MGLLTSCSVIGNSAKSWLEGSPLVSRAKVFTCWCVPRVTATLRDSVTESQVRQFAVETSDYLRRVNSAKAPQDTVDIDLDYRSVSFDIKEDRNVTTEIVDRAFAVSHDPRVTSVAASESFTSISTSRDQLADVYARYANPEKLQLTVYDDKTSLNFHVGDNDPTGSRTCTPQAALVAEARNLLADSRVTGARLDLCNALDVAVAKANDAGAIRSRFLDLASDPALSSIQFSVTSGGSKNNPYDPSLPLYSSSSFYGVTPDTLAVLKLLAVTPGVRGYDMSYTLQVWVSNPATLRSVVERVGAQAVAAGIPGIGFSSGSVSVYDDKDAGPMSAQLDLIDEMSRLQSVNTGLRFDVNAMDITISIPKYTSKLGHAVVDAVQASGLWRKRTVNIDFPDHANPSISWDVGGKQKTPRTDHDSDERIKDLGSYWSAHSGGSRGTTVP